nr:gustatory receptor 46 [Papilio machaon]
MLRSKFRLEKCNKALKKHKSDFMLDNFVEAKVKSVLRPLYLAQYLSLAPKYSILYDLITSNSYKFNAFVCMIATGVLAAWLYYVLDYWNQCNGLLAATVFAYSVSLTIAFIFNSSITTTKSNNYAYLMILIRRILKRFKFSKADARNVTAVNYVYIMSIIMFNVLHYACRSDDSYGIFGLKIFTQFVYFSFDCNTIICVRITNLLGNRIDAWVTELYCVYQKCDKGHIEVDNTSLKTVIRDYEQMVEVFKIYCQVFKHTILLTIVVIFFQVLVNVQSMILVSNSLINRKYYVHVKVWTRSATLASLAWVKNIILLSLLSMEAENVNLKMKNSRVICLLLSVKEEPDDQFLDLCCLLRRQRQQANVWRGRREPLPLDAALLPRFLAVVATYTVAILQFHFL